jgi:GntR family phosphonate transport system transcriptional regulator
VSLWRQIGESLVHEIDQGVFRPGERLPASSDLALRFGVNQHTVLRAIAHLQDEGHIRIERGRGAFVAESPIPYRMGARTRFEQNLLEVNRAPARELVTLIDLPASAAVAAALAISEGDPVTLVALIGKADEVPLSYGQNYFPTQRLPRIAEAFRMLSAGPAERFSITEALRAVGVRDFRRSRIVVRSRPPWPDEARHLRMPLNESVLDLAVTNVNARGGKPVMYATTCFCASRVEFVIDPQ